MSELPVTDPDLRPRAHRWTVAGALLVITGFVFSGAFAGNLLAQRDLLRLTVPYRALAAEQWAAGVLPLWNSAAGCGTPLLADPVAGVLDPATALFLLPLPPLVVGTWIIILRYALAGFFMARFLRLRGLDALSAGAGGAAYMLAGFSIGSWTMFQWVAALPLLPLALAVPHSGGTPAGRGLAAASIFSLYIFSGAPEPLAAALLLWLLETRSTHAETARPWVRGFLVEVGIGLLAMLAFSLVLSLPTIELLMASDRWGGRGALRALSYSVTPLVGIGHLLPLTFLGENGGPAPSQLFPFPHPLFFGTYIGVSLLPLALLGIFGSRVASPERSPRRSGRITWWIVALVGWLAAYGSTLPGMTALALRWPWLTVLGFPVKFFVLVPPCLAVLAAQGLADLASPGFKEKNPRAIPAALTATGVLILGFCAWGVIDPGTTLGPVHEANLFATLQPALVAASQHVLVIVLAVVVILLGVLPEHPRTALWLMSAVIVIDLAVAARGAITWENRDLTQEPAIRGLMTDEWPRVLTTSSDDFANGGSGARHVHALADVGSGIAWRVRHAGMYASFQDRAWNRWWDEVIAAPDSGLQRLGAEGVRWFACDSGVAIPAIRSGFRIAGRTDSAHGDLFLLAHPSPLPEVRFYAGEAPPGFDRLLRAGDSVSMTGRHRLDGALELRISTSVPGWIFRAESWFPGWGVESNQGRSDALPAPRMPGQLIRVSAGERNLAWTYRPVLVSIGLAGSLAAALLATAALALSLLRRGRTA